jgi:hypothetical protein
MGTGHLAWSGLTRTDGHSCERERKHEHEHKFEYEYEYERECEHEHDFYNGWCQRKVLVGH